MRLLAVPHTPSATSIRLWLAATDTRTPPNPTTLRVTSLPDRVITTGWTPVTAGGHITAGDSRTFTQVVELTGLPPGQRFTAAFGEARCSFSTLPARLPGLHDAPFTVLLGSCYYARNNRGLATVVDRILAQAPPHLKVLSGDQVYLDISRAIVPLPRTREGLAKDYLAKYLRNWTDDGGFSKLLANGASLFTSDDHEFWNNFPNAASIITQSWVEAGRNAMRETAGPLFATFQSDGAVPVGASRQFSAGSLSFFVADTRFHREEGGRNFMPDGALQAMISWIANLSGPGVLVVGQPIFETPPNFLGDRFVDRNLTSYKQYDTLTRALHAAKHSVLVLTGDVHHSRVATTVRGHAEISEVIASPSALVAGSHSVAPSAPSFPNKDIGIPPIPVHTFPESLVRGDNLATIAFTETPGRITAKVTFWYAPPEKPTSDAILLTLE